MKISTSANFSISAPIASSKEFAPRYSPISWMTLVKKQVIRENQEKGIVRVMIPMVTINCLEVIRPNYYHETPRSRAHFIIINSKLPTFYMLFRLNPKNFPTVFKVWLGHVNLALERRFTRDNDPNRVVVVTCNEYNITMAGWKLKLKLVEIICVT